LATSGARELAIDTGAKAFCAIRSYLQTARKHRLQALDVLVMLFNGEPWVPPRALSPP